MEDLAEQVQRLAHALGRRVRAEVRAVAPVALAREVDAGIVLVERDRDVRVALVVAQADVEARPVLLDEALLGQQRLRLGRDDERLDAVDPLAHRRRLARRRGGEVRCDALAHGLRLADVDHAPERVLEGVDAGLVWERPALLFEARGAVGGCGGLGRRDGLGGELWAAWRARSRARWRARAAWRARSRARAGRSRRRRGRLRLERGRPCGLVIEDRRGPDGRRGTPSPSEGPVR